MASPDRLAALRTGAADVILRQQELVDRLLRGDEVADAEIDQVATADVAAAMKRLRRLTPAPGMAAETRRVDGVLVVDDAAELLPPRVRSATAAGSWRAPASAATPSPRCAPPHPASPPAIL